MGGGDSRYVEDIFAALWLFIRRLPPRCAFETRLGRLPPMNEGENIRFLMQDHIASQVVRTGVFFFSWIMGRGG